MQRMDSQISAWALLACLCFSVGCTPLLKWNGDKDLAFEEEARQPPAEFMESIGQTSRKPRSPVDDDPPPAPDPSVIARTIERRADDAPAEKEEIQREPQRSEQLALGESQVEGTAEPTTAPRRDVAPTERNLSKVYDSTPQSGGGIDLSQTRTMRGPNLDIPDNRRDDLNHPTTHRLGNPAPLRSATAQPAAPDPRLASQQMPVVEAAQGHNATQSATGLNRLPPTQGPREQVNPYVAAGRSTDPNNLPIVEKGPGSTYGGLEPRPYPMAGQPTLPNTGQPYSHHPSTFNGPPAQSPSQAPPRNDPRSNGYGNQGQESFPSQPQVVNNPHVQPADPNYGHGVRQASHDSGYPRTTTPNGPKPATNSEVLVSTDWRRHLELAIAALETKLNRASATPPPNGEDPGAPRRLLPLERQEIADLDARLRMLYLVAGMRDSALMPVQQYDESNQEFYKYAMNGLSVYLDREKHPVDDRRLKLALRDMREAVDRLSSASGLDVRNLAFCSKVNSFGSFEEFPEYQFSAGQELLLYVEVENFAAERSTEGYETALLGSYRLYDSRKSRVADHMFIEEVEVCRNRRRDYFVTYRMWMPEDIAPGTYTLQLTMEDLKGNTSGQSSIRFEIE